MSGLRRMLMNKKGGFYIKSVDAGTLEETSTYAYYIGIELSQPLSASGISSLKVDMKFGVRPDAITIKRDTMTVTASGYLGHNTYRVPVFRSTIKFRYYKMTVTPMAGSTALEALPEISGEIT